MNSKISMATVCLSALMATEVNGSFQEEYDASQRAGTLVYDVNNANILVSGNRTHNLINDLSNLNNEIDDGVAGNSLAAIRKIIAAVAPGAASASDATTCVKNALGVGDILTAAGHVRTLIDNNNPVNANAEAAITGVNNVIDGGAAAGNALAAVNSVKTAADGNTAPDVVTAVNGVRTRLVAGPLHSSNALGDLNIAINLVNGAGVGEGVDLTTSLNNLIAAVAPGAASASDSTTSC